MEDYIFRYFAATAILSALRMGEDRKICKTVAVGAGSLKDNGLQRLHGSKETYTQRARFFILRIKEVMYRWKMY